MRRPGRMPLDRMKFPLTLAGGLHGIRRGPISAGLAKITIYRGLTPYAAIQAQNFRTPQLQRERPRRRRFRALL
jgi:hypothetical protein